jgi:hypothetical protein
MMELQRRIPLTMIVGLLVVAVILGSLDESRTRVPDSARNSMRAASAFYDSLVPTTRGIADAADVSDSAVVQLGYLERLRLGLGSPFRLVHFALVDPRLDDASRRRLAWGLLDRTRRGDDYVIDPVVLDGMGPWFDSTHFATGADHLAFIRRTIDDADDPRTGELAVRLAYDIAVAERTVREPAARIATQVAALERDRLLAMRDVGALFARARGAQTDPLEQLVIDRRERRFRIENPPAIQLSSQLEGEAMDAVPHLLERIRRLGAGEADVGTPVELARYSVLGAASAARLAQLGAELPPQTPVAVALQVARPSLIVVRGGPSVERRRLAEEALNEETLTGRYAALLTSDDSARREPTLAVLASAVQLRAYAQEEPWFPGMPGPSASEVASRFGLREISFDPSVRASWRPYYARMIGASIADLQRVLPALSLSGLGIRFGIGDLPDTALSMHDPSTRTLRLSVVTSAGTLAHEFAHDLDWQAARRLYAKGGGYSTDRAMVEPRGQLANSVRGLAAARIGSNGPGGTHERPAELFARDVDWFVAVGLAREGRSNGYLTAVQDAALTGYTAASPRDMIAGAGSALADALAQMTYVPEATREAFLDDWSAPARIDPSVLTRRVAELQLPRRDVNRRRLFDRGTMPFALPDEVPLCASGANAWSPGVRDRRALLELVLDARARGIARRWAMWYSASSRPAWASSVMGVSPYAPDTGDRFVRRIREALVWELESGADPGERLVPALALFHGSGSDCASGD